MTIQIDDLYLQLSLHGADSRRLFMARSVFDHFGGVIAYGPMKGFRLDPESSWNAADLGSKIFGLYEQEVLTMLQNCRGKTDVLVNLGAADGYYGVGMIKGGLFAKSVCYEATEAGREVIAKTAELNQVADRLDIRGAADAGFTEDLQASGIDLSRCLILSDIEGGEFDVFSPECIAKLRQAVLLIELHEFMVPDGEARAKTLIDDLGAAFKLTFVTTGARDLSKFAELANVNDTDRWLICSEGRAKLMTWVLCEPK